jgi:asparagine synthetase B (glutamine-hydrolysing)
MVMRVRDLINENIQLLIGYGKPGLLFSGGTDSTCLLFSLLELGYQPTLYTYTLDSYESDDLIHARLIASHYRLPLVVGTVPTDHETVVRDVKRMLMDGIRGKVAIQSLHGHYYLAPQVRESIIVNGSGIDPLYGVYRTFALDGSHNNKVTFDSRRRRKHLDNPKDQKMLRYYSSLYERHNTSTVFPYNQGNIIEFLMQLSWPEINEPRWKWITVKDYWNEFEQFDGYFRSRGSQQIVAGTRKLHDELLNSPINRQRRRGVNQLYEDLAVELNLEP